MSGSGGAGRRKPLIPVTVLTGFLGSGKTTVLNRLLKDPAMAGTAVIINEFGEIGLDHLLVSSADDGLIELSSGCLCCTIRGELAITLEDLLRGVDNHRIETLSRIVIETTGLADPAPVLQSILTHPYLPLRYRVDGVVTVVDAVNGAASLDAQPEAVKQVAIADRILLSKTDLPQADPAIRARVAAINPGAAILPASEATASDLVGLSLFDPAAKSAEVRAWLAEDAFAEHDHGHDHGDHHDHGHHDHHGNDPNRHGDVRAFALASDNAMPRRALAQFLELLATAHGPALLRVKGIVKIAEEPDRPMVIQGAQKLLHPPLILEAWPDADHRTRLVFITRGLDEEFVRRMFEAFAGELRPDTADPRTLADNPLAISGFSGRFG